MLYNKLFLTCTAESMVFVADYSGHAIFMADFSSDSLDSLTFNALPFSSVRYPMGVDYDPDTRMVYWSEVCRIHTTREYQWHYAKRDRR